MNKYCLVVLIVLAAVCVADPPFPTWDDFKGKQNLHFTNPAEENYRRTVFQRNIARMEAHNADPEATHKEGPNQFTYMSDAEFIALLLTASPPKNSKNTDTSGSGGSTTPIVGAWAPTAVDLTTKLNYITSVKNQGGCGSCWAFATVAAMESLNFIGYGVVGSNLSEQQLTSCSTSYGNSGCNGGWTTYAYNYVKAKGLTTEALYPYTSGSSGLTGTCLISTGSFKISGYTAVSATCSALAVAVQLRPISVAVDATKWSGYASGIFKNCNTSINHAVLLVGVNSTVWKIKNSWGTTWGQLGYILLSASNGNNTCNVCTYGSYPNK